MALPAGSPMYYAVLFHDVVKYKQSKVKARRNIAAGLLFAFVLT